MPLTVSLGVNRKIGLPAYSSVGASCHVELELESSLLQSDLEKFFRHVRDAYAACTAAVHEQLERAQEAPAARPAPLPAAAALSHAGALSPSGNGNGHTPTPSLPTLDADGEASFFLRASSRQLSFARQLATQIDGLGLRRLDALTEQLLGKTLADLTRADAAVLVQTLKNRRRGAADLKEILEDDLP